MLCETVGRMRILCLSKRRYMRHDLINDRYGRMWHLPWEYARNGHDVLLIATSYYAAADGTSSANQAADSRLRVGALALPWFAPWRFWRYRRRLLALAADFRPDLIVGYSDALQLSLAGWLAGRLGVRLQLDFYDNFDSYSATRLPGLAGGLRRAVRQADQIDCISRPLQTYLVHKYRPACPVSVLENGVHEAAFSVVSAVDARQALGLPAAGHLIGMAGDLSARKGASWLLAAFADLAHDHPERRLVLAGNAPPGGWQHPQCIYLGALPHAQMANFWRALDVAVVLLKDDAFGRYCHPQKAVEMAAAGVPMVVPDRGVFTGGAGQEYGVCYIPDSAADLARAIEQQLRQPQIPAYRPLTWAALAALSAQRFRAEPGVIGMVSSV